MNIRQYQKEYLRRHAGWERRVKGIFYKALSDSVRPVLATLKANDLNETTWLKAYKKAFGLIGTEASRFEYKQLKTENPTKAEGDIVSFYNEDWRLFMERYGSEVGIQIISELNSFTRQQIERSLAESIAAGLTTTQTISAIRKATLGEVGRNRAMRIARTETTTAANKAKEYGARTYFKEIGESQGYKMWISRADAKVRHDHDSVNETAVLFSEPFNVGGYNANLPGDTKLPAKERINCRCTFVSLSAAGYRRRFGGANG